MKALEKILRQFEKDVTNFTKTGSARRTTNYLSGRLSMLEKIIETADLQYDKVLSSLGPEDKQQEAEAEAIYEKIREGYFDHRSDLLDAIDKSQLSKAEPNDRAADTKQVMPTTSRSPEVRLPKINLPVFSGSYETWRAFRDLFVALIHHNASLSEVQKMHYLKSSVSGEADKLLAHLSMDSGNYAKAWEILKDRYDHQRFLVNTQLKCLFSQPTILQERAAPIKELLDTSVEVVHSLANLTVPVEHWDVLLIFVLLQKLPVKTQHLWEERLGSKVDSKALPTFAELTQFLETRFRTLEAVDQQQTQISQKSIKLAAHRNVLHTTTNTTKYFCRICNKGQHAIRKCGKFLKMSITDRVHQVNQLGICRNCLAYSHSSEGCQSSRRCYYCQQPHHSLLHSNHAPAACQRNSLTAHASISDPSSSRLHANTPAFQPSERETDVIRPNVNSFYTNAKTQVLLATAIVKVSTITGEYLSLRALLDSGSEASFITTSAVQLLCLPLKPTSVEVSGLGLVTSGVCSRAVDISLASHHSTFRASTQALVLKSLSGHLPTHTLTTTGWEHLNGLTLADPNFNMSNTVDLLLGSDVLADILLPDLIKPRNTDLPIAQKTKLGWILFGRTPITSKRVNSFLQTCKLETQLRKFWELEEVPHQPQGQPEDIECEAHFVNHVRRLPDGRFEVALPFKGNVYPLLGRSKDGALNRFQSLERRLQTNSSLKQKYTDCLTEYLTLGHMEEVGDVSLADPYTYYLPHHAVVKEGSSTTKLRVVFDASCKTADGVSLNDQLMVGPALQHNIMDRVLRWRLYRYTFTADIEKMYRQIRVPERDANYQLILWRKQPTDVLKTYRLNTVTFGTAPAPYLAIRTLQALADEVKGVYPRAAEMIRDDMYVDDLVSGADSLQEALSKMNEVRAILNSAGFHLRKWAANDDALLMDIPPEQRENGSCLPFETDSSPQIKTLGIRWYPVSDSFSFQNIFAVTSEAPTKRSVLSTIAKLFDPLGWISPCIIVAKILMQQLWCTGLAWDDPISAELKEQWVRFQRELPVLENIQIPRWVHVERNVRDLEIHGFSDASEKAYGAVVYLRIQDKSDNVHVHLLTSKTRVAPLKTVTLPRLELCAAVMLAALLDYSKRVLSMGNIKTFAWTDSTITLAWIAAPPAKWKTFVSNRVAEIQRLTEGSIWRYIPTSHNPADLASRGSLPSDLIKHTLWWKGPAFLKAEWNFQFPIQPTTTTTDEETRRVKSHYGTTEENDISRLIHRHSNLRMLLRIVSYCLRFISNLRRKEKQLTTLSPIEIDSALKVVVKVAQRSMFFLNPKDTQPIIKGIKSLQPFVDEIGILRVGGRLQNSNLSFERRHPILLKPGHHLSQMIIRDAHDTTYHGGTQLMIAHLRQRFWILSVKNAVKKCIHACTICFRHRANPVGQFMGNFPAPRVRISRPFSHTGVDYAGPIEVKAWKGRGSKTYKAYFAIFVCLATKALHIELVSDMTTKAFIAAFRRFSARRGLCKVMFSDCGKNFVGAAKELHNLRKAANYSENQVAETLLTDGTQWKFIPPASPHFGGLWEAGVKSVKYHLRRVTKTTTFTFEELTTLLTQIEGCLNSRPLCPLTSNPDDFTALTPAHFLIGEPIKGVPEPHTDEEKLCYNDRWKRIQQLYQTFWRQWSSEYLSRLQQRPKWLKIQEQPQLGDLVLVKDERLPPTKWMMARVIQTHPGKDNLIRVVTLKTQTGELKRPVTKICLLPSNKAAADQALI